MAFFIVLWVMFGIVTGLAAQARGRNALGWFCVGCVGGVFGLVAVLVMENLKDKPLYPEQIVPDG